jgi:hypothetical protein
VPNCRVAALSGGCTIKYFTEQYSVTPENVKSKLEGFARSVPGIRMTDFQNCLQNEMSLGLILRDLDLASANSVDATPALLINGTRITGIKAAAQLRQLITEAKKKQIGQLLP